MKIERKSETIVEIDGVVRLEQGPIRRREIATEEILDNAVTARHYQVGLPDALGKPIVIGESFDFIDWKSREKVWYVYSLDSSSGKWIREAYNYASYEDALSFATEIVAARKAGE